jgi:hypothetical protein
MRKIVTLLAALFAVLAVTAPAVASTVHKAAAPPPVSCVLGNESLYNTSYGNYMGWDGNPQVVTFGIQGGFCRINATFVESDTSDCVAYNATLLNIDFTPNCSAAAAQWVGTEYSNGYTFVNSYNHECLADDGNGDAWIHICNDGVAKDVFQLVG